MEENQKNTKKKSGLLQKLLIIIPVIAIIFSAYNIISMLMEDHRAASINTELIESVNHNKDELIVLTKRDYNELKEKNGDFVGWISFNSGIINEPIVQAADNDYYLRRDFYGKPLELGTVFMDASHTLSSKNMTMYGHYVYRDNSSMFTPLNLLTDEENYEINRNFTFSDDTYQRNYEVSKVFYHSTSNDTHINYMIGDYNSDENFMDYIETISSRSLYDTGVEISKEDNIITLQTCVKDDADARLIIIGKEIERLPIVD